MFTIVEALSLRMCGQVRGHVSAYACVKSCVQPVYAPENVLNVYPNPRVAVWSLG